nr:MAG TPA: hypothetical protein [Caudoviricetes sp.]
MMWLFRIILYKKKENPSIPFTLGMVMVKV